MSRARTRRTYRAPVIVLAALQYFNDRIKSLWLPLGAHQANRPIPTAVIRNAPNATR